MSATNISTLAKARPEPLSQGGFRRRQSAGCRISGQRAHTGNGREGDQRDDESVFDEVLAQPTIRNGKRVRALRPWASDDIALLEAVNRGEFTINGLRNRDLQALLFSAPAGSEKEKRRRSAAISRKIRILRAHGLLQKVPRTHRCQVTTAARKAITALLTATQATLAQLSSLAT